MYIFFFCLLDRVMVLNMMINITMMTIWFHHWVYFVYKAILSKTPLYLHNNYCTRSMEYIRFIIPKTFSIFGNNFYFFFALLQQTTVIHFKTLKLITLRSLMDSMLKLQQIRWFSDALWHI